MNKDLWLFKRPAVVGALLIFGPLALPLLWISSHFKMQAKIILSVVFIGLAVLTYIYMPVLLDRIAEQAQSAGLAQ